MARGINKAIIVGHLGQDPDVRHMPSGKAVTSISLATTENWTDKQSGNKQERTEWSHVVLFGRLGEIAGEYLKKGSQVYIEGSLRTEKWQDKQGNDRYTTKIIANELQMLGSRPEGRCESSPTSGNDQGQNYHDQPMADDDDYPF